MSGNRILSYSRHHGRLGDRLPAGVREEAWRVEQRTLQNPRIRTLLRALSKLDGLVDGNLTLLHCSAEVLAEALRKTKQASQILATQFATVIEPPSVVPAIEEELESIRYAFENLERAALADLRKLTLSPARSEQMGNRKLLSLCIGRLHAFLQDSLVRLLAADPRSRHDSNHYLMKRFLKEKEDTEWLHYSVCELRDELEALNRWRELSLTRISAAIRREGVLPSGEAELVLRRFLARLQVDLLPCLRSLLTQSGVRYEEVEVLDRMVVEIPKLCTLIEVLWTTTREAEVNLEQLRRDGISERAMATPRIVLDDLCRRVADQIERLDQQVKDLSIFVPFWQYGVEGRRTWRLSIEKGKSEDRDD